MTTVLICLSVAMLAAGIVIAVLPSASKGNHKITIRNDNSVVTVRSAGSSDITVTFDPSDLHSQEPPMELQPGMETLAENERTVVEEFVDPSTPIERKREIAKTFNGLKCTFKFKEDIDHNGVPEDYYESAEGCDEGMLFPEPGDESLE